MNTLPPLDTDWGPTESSPSWWTPPSLPRSRSRKSSITKTERKRCPLLLSLTVYLMPAQAFISPGPSLLRTPQASCDDALVRILSLDWHVAPLPPSFFSVNQRLSPRRLTQLSKKAAALIRVLWQVPSLAAGIREQLGGMPTDKRGLLTALNVFSRLKSVCYQGLVKLSPWL